MMKSTAILYILIAALIFASASADDINNPVSIYMPHQWPWTRPHIPPDSILSGSLEFVQLPEYMKTTQVLITHICRFDTDKGFVFLCDDNFEYSITLKKHVIEFPGEYKIGDTISAVFDITPIRVGCMNLSFSIFEIPDSMSIGNRLARRRGGGNVKVLIRLGSDGQTAAIASAKGDYRYVSPFGISTDLIKDSIIFYKNPKPIVHKYSFSMQEVFDNVPHLYVFSIKTVVKPNPKVKNELAVDCYVSPFRDFEKGIGFMIGHPAALYVSDESLSLPCPVYSSQTYQFSAKLTFPTSGVYKVLLAFMTRNLDTTKNTKRPAIMGKRKHTGNLVEIYIGVDENNNIFFISDRNPYYDQTQPEKFLEPISMIDSRFQMIKNLPLLSSHVVDRSKEFFQVIPEP